MRPVHESQSDHIYMCGMIMYIIDLVVDYSTYNYVTVRNIDCRPSCKL